MYAPMLNQLLPVSSYSYILNMQAIKFECWNSEIYAENWKQVHRNILLSFIVSHP